MQVEDALKVVRDFLKGLRFTDAADDIAFGFTHFSKPQLGGLTLTGDERIAYHRCLNALVKASDSELAKAIKKNNPKENSFSRRGLADLLQTAILQAWKGEEGLRELPEERIDAAIKWLRKALAAPAKSYVVYMAAVGIDLRSLPVRIGKLRLVAGDSEDAAALIAAMHANTMSSPYEANQKELIKQAMHRDISAAYRNKAIIEVEVRTADEDNAEEKALTICRQTLDVINFFADIIYGRDTNACVSLVGEGGEIVEASDEERAAARTLS